MMNRMYIDLAWTWPIISPPEDYVEEAEEFARLIRQHSRNRAQTVLHLGCGGGHIDRTLKRYFQVTGVDLSPEMLSLARELNPEVEYVPGDMRTQRLKRNFDGVLIADSIVYMLTETELRAAFQTAWDHLVPGGVFCTYAEHLHERFEQDALYCTSHSRANVTIHLVHNYFDPDPADTSFEMVFVSLIRQDGKISIEVDRHTAGLFLLETWDHLLSEVGFQITHFQTLAGDTGFVCIKPGR